MGLEQEFVSWFRARGPFYASLPLKRYCDGEPYFSSQGAECNLRDYLRWKEAIRGMELPFAAKRRA